MLDAYALELIERMKKIMGEVLFNTSLVLNLQNTEGFIDNDEIKKNIEHLKGYKKNAEDCLNILLSLDKNSSLEYADTVIKECLSVSEKMSTL